MKFKALPPLLAALAIMMATPWNPARAIDRAAPIVIKFSHVVANDTPKGKAALRFKQLAEQLSGGQVRVEVYPNSQLYRDNEEFEALQLGAVQMLAPSLAKFGPLGVRQFEVFDLPYLFPDKAALYRVTKGPIGRALLKKLEPKGILGLAYWDNGFKAMSSNKPLRVPADFKGQRMRIQPSRVLYAQMRTLGAKPQILAFGDVYQALRSGAIDGAENPPSNFYTQRMHEVQRHLTLSDHGYLGYAVIVNRKFWEGLPAPVRALLEEAMRQASEYANAIAQQENDAAIEAVRKAGTTRVHVLSHNERKEWREALAPVHQKMESRIGREILAAVRREIGGAQGAR